MKRREMLGLLGLVVVSSKGAGAEGMGSMTFYNYSYSQMRVLINYREQCAVDAWQSAVYSLELGDHQLEAYRGTDYYSYSFRLTRTTPCRTLTLQDKDF